jgi:hypothetical protein
MINFIILGAQKAATSALQASLRKHPLIFMPKGESTFFEDPDYQACPWENFAPEEPIGVMKGIKRPDYLCSDQARDRIKSALPTCKFIVVLREPISRTLSSYCYMVRHAHLPALPLNEGIQNCIDDFKSGQKSRAATVISYGLYGNHLEKWMNFYEKDKFLFLSQQEVSNNLKGVLQKILIHIGIPKDDLSEIPIVKGDSNIGLYDSEMLKIARFASQLKTRPIQYSSRRLPRAMPLRLVGSLISKYAEVRARQKGQVREVLSSELTKQLQEIFSEDAQTLIKVVYPELIKWVK